MIYKFEIEDMIKKLENSGQTVTCDTHAIYASPTAQFRPDVYPLEIIPVDTMPDGTVCVITRKPQNEL